MNNYFETVAYIATSIAVIISVITFTFEFNKYKEIKKQEYVQNIINSILKLIDIIQEQKDFIQYKLTSICILKSIQINCLNNICNILINENQSNETNRAICKQLLVSNNKYVLPHSYQNYQKRNKKIYKYMSVDFKNDSTINNQLQRLYSNIQNLENSIDNKIQDIDLNNIFEIIKRNAKISENNQKCEIDFKQVIDNIHMEYFNFINQSQRQLQEECNNIIDSLKKQLNSIT